MSEFDQLNHITCFSDKESLFVSEVTNKLDSGKANIVVPYGCNRYEILLEIIKKIGRKCLIVSAYSFLKNELADSFSAFLKNKKDAYKYFSGDFDCVKPITSVLLTSLGEKFFSSNSKITPMSLKEFVKSNDIGMVVFNEIHHLSPIDQKVIGAALSELDEVKTLFFSSLVPYDADCSYYAKHAFMCGEIDLIMNIEKSERPHADTARYSLPSTEEKIWFDSRQNDVENALNQILAIPSAQRLFSLESYSNSTGNKFAVSIEERLDDKNTSDSIERNLGFVKDLFPLVYEKCDADTTERINEILRSRSLVEKKRFVIDYSEKQRAALAFSPQKLEDICQILHSERNRCGESMTVAVLADGKKEPITKIGSLEELKTVSTVNIFERLRRESTEKLCLFTAHSVIMPSDCQKYLGDKNCTARPVQDKNYSSYEFKRPQKEVAAIIGKLSQMQCFSVIISSPETLCSYFDEFLFDCIITSSFSGDDKCADILRAKELSKNSDAFLSVRRIITLLPCDDSDYLPFASLDFASWQTSVMRYDESKVFDGYADIKKCGLSLSSIKSANEKAEADAFSANERQPQSQTFGFGRSVSIVENDSKKTNRTLKTVTIVSLTAACLIAVFVAIMPFIFSHSPLMKIFFTACLAPLIALTSVVFAVRYLHNDSHYFFVKNVAACLAYALKRSGKLPQNAKVKISTKDCNIIVSLTGADFGQTELYATALNSMFFTRLDCPHFLKRKKRLDQATNLACPINLSESDVKNFIAHAKFTVGEYVLVNSSDETQFYLDGKISIIKVHKQPYVKRLLTLK